MRSVANEIITAANRRERFSRRNVSDADRLAWMIERAYQMGRRDRRLEREKKQHRHREAARARATAFDSITNYRENVSRESRV